MCDLLAVKRALDAWLIPDVVRIECVRELPFSGDPDFEEAPKDNSREYHFTKIMLKTPPCVCGVIHTCECPIWQDLGAFAVDGKWALSSLGFPETEGNLIDDVYEDFTQIEYWWP